MRPQTTRRSTENDLLKDLLLQKQHALVATDSDLLDKLVNEHCGRVQTLNLHHLALAKSDPAFRDATTRANWISADGWPVQRAYVALGSKVDRVTGSKFVRMLLSDERAKAKKLGLLGANSEAGIRFRCLASQCGCCLVFSEHGAKQEWNAPRIARVLNNMGVDILLIAVTPPFSEVFAQQMVDAGFRGNMIAIGGAIDMITGVTRPSPKVLQAIGMEWAFRLVQEPKRLAKRYFLECLPVMFFDVAPLIVSRKVGSLWNRRS